MTASDNTISDTLLHWYDEHARDLPWRARPGEPAPDPYRVWLSEVMLQQTTVAAVKPYFEKFTSTWPTVDALAAAEEAEVMGAWAGLGYYSRARNLAKCAREVAGRGSFPDTEAELRKLPGVGDYTAAAIAAIAFERRAVVIDANVERVVARLFDIRETLPQARKVIRARAEEITPEHRSGDFAQAMMDLGSGICTARAPKCLLCPLSAQCEGRKAGDPAELPIKAPKKSKPERVGQAFWIERDGHVWLVTRKGSGMLGGMRALPDDGWTAQQDGSAEPLPVGEWNRLGAVKHVFTHAALTLSVLRYEGTQDPVEEGEWWPLDRLDEAGLPTLFAKAARLATAQSG
ncbi:A /G-specific adenine glycosylase [Altererythrobacter epoxidivorans]|uniref:Adenine DNA glycosylase n=1 Tax=Altererythrobacter epoxidivorans TaxID=361183 RepID=A0A0M4LV29_9SPHN|nr:A/G-specific adenine glycosylase [Altererythrobacter epoxidivorans]ALE16917.1 A /G-specific adenine glycosylase [Altererythrobacter epoxidivorans]